MLELMERTKSGQRIEQRREHLRIPQAELARTLGVKRASVWGWEKEGKLPRQDVLLRLADALSTSTAYLLGETDDPSPLRQLSEPTSPSTPPGSADRPSWVEDLRASVTVVSERTEAAILDQKIGFIGEMVRIGEQLERRDARQEERDIRQEQRDAQQASLLQGLMGVIDRNTSTIDDCRLESRETRKALEDLQRESRETREALARATATIASLKARLEAEVGPGDPVLDEQRDRGQWMGLRVQGRTHSEGEASA